MILELLPAVLEKLGLGREIEAVVQEVIGGGEGTFDLRKGVVRQVQTRVTAQEGRTGAQMLARALYKQVDAFIEQDARGLTHAQRVAICQELCNNAARELVGAATEVALYAQVAGAVKDAKEKQDPKAMSTARRDRSISNERLKSRLLNTVRAVAGDEPQGV